MRTVENIRRSSPWILVKTSFHLLLTALCLTIAASAYAAAGEDKAGAEKDTYSQESVIKDATDFFGETTEGLAKVIEKAFQEHGRPNGYIKGQEIAGAIAVGLRYGDGTLTLKNGGSSKVFWQGPSVGFDLGANVSKVFILVYHLPKVNDVFQRFPGVDGSLYYVAGAGINYQQKDNIVLAPIRLGVGLRTGASVGYIHYTKAKTLNPL